ncbi:MAG: gamma-glutamyltransferase family protein [Lachnospiraceae bacterium]
MRRKTGIIAILLVVVLAVVGVVSFKSKKTNKDLNYKFEPSETIEANTIEEDGRSYSVSTSNDIATVIGMQVLEAGGNAVDAAVAVSYVLGVVEPYASGLGGSGGMLIYDMNTETVEFFDYRAKSGVGNNYSDNVAIPGMVAGMEAVHEAYGSMDMADLIQPAVDYAENGFTINDTLKFRIDSAKKFLSTYSIFYDDKNNWVETGDTLYQKELAETLRAIQKEGASVFYNGYIAEDLAEHTSLTMEDLANYEVLKGDVVKGSYKDYTVYSAGAPLSGVTLIQMLEMAEAVNMADPNEDINKYIEQLEKITNRAYASRYSTIADPTMYEVDEEYLVSDSYIHKLLEEEGLDEYMEEDVSTDTTSFSIVDSNGLVVTATNTISDFWGSRILVDGIFMNDTITNFSQGINAYESNKRIRSFTAPTIVVGEDGYVLAVGTPGGNNIPRLLFNVLIDVLEYGCSPQEAIDKSIVLSKNNTLYIEADRNGETWVDVDKIDRNFVWIDSGTWWGCISCASYLDSEGANAAYDYRRGATMAGCSKKE